jgi:hypothetical protein
LVGRFEVPQVDPEVVGRDVGLTVGVERDRVDVIGMGVGENLPRHSRLLRLLRSAQCAKQLGALALNISERVL